MFKFPQILTPQARYRLALVSEIRRHPCEKISRIILVARSVRRVLLSNALNLRESVAFISRRVADLYRTGRFSLLQERTFARSHQFFLGACLISFAQDMITEDEMIQTVESFNIEKYNENLTKISTNLNNESEKILVDKNNVSKIQNTLSTQPESQKAILLESNLSSLQGPITLYIREMRSVLAKRKEEFLTSMHSRVVGLPVDAEVEIIDLPIPPPSKLTSIVDCLLPDGTHFVDSTWEVVMERPDLRMWRRCCLRPTASLMLHPNQTECSHSYEYRVCGTFTDISARCFLEVQLNLAYRRKWDSQVALLDILRPRLGNNDQTEIIRWVAKFPFPMAKREYLYARRWWAEISQHVDDKSKPQRDRHDLALIISRAVSPEFASQAIKDAEQSSPDVMSVESRQHLSWYSSLGPNVVTVREYESNMLIKSHGSLDEPGLDYFLTYYDDPQLSLSKETTSWLSSTFLPKLLDQLHAAAVSLTKHSFPVGVFPVIMNMLPTSSAYVSPEEALVDNFPSDSIKSNSCVDSDTVSRDSATNMEPDLMQPSLTPSSSSFITDSQSNNSYQLFI